MSAVRAFGNNSFHRFADAPTAFRCIVKIIEQAEKGEQTIAAVCREHGMAEQTFYRWRKTYGGMSVNEVQRLKELEAVQRSTLLDAAVCGLI